MQEYGLYFNYTAAFRRYISALTLTNDLIRCRKIPSNYPPLTICIYRKTGFNSQQTCIQTEGQVVS